MGAGFQRSLWGSESASISLGSMWTGSSGNYLSRMNGYSIGVQNGFLSPNCVRELEHRHIPEEEGNAFMSMAICLSSKMSEPMQRRRRRDTLKFWNWIDNKEKDALSGWAIAEDRGLAMR